MYKKSTYKKLTLKIQSLQSQHYNFIKKVNKVKHNNNGNVVNLTKKQLKQYVIEKPKNYNNL